MRQRYGASFARKSPRRFWEKTEVEAELRELLRAVST
jgi:hypothetical protein